METASVLTTCKQWLVCNDAENEPVNIVFSSQYSPPQSINDGFIHLQAVQSRHLQASTIQLQAELENFSWQELAPQDSPPTLQMNAELVQICDEPFGLIDGWFVNNLNENLDGINPGVFDEPSAFGRNWLKILKSVLIHLFA